jgi:transcriptional regulator with XRE-family HTH domain
MLIEMTQQEVADKFGVSEGTVNELIKKLRNGNFAETEDFKPFLYNIWNVSKESNNTTF